LIDGVEVELICPKSFGKLTVDSTGNVICLPESEVQSYNLTAGYGNYNSFPFEWNSLLSVVIKNLNFKTMKMLW
jgi:hypothetical protein